jgi:hypothetical protein
MNNNNIVPPILLVYMHMQCKWPHLVLTNEVYSASECYYCFFLVVFL